MTTPGGQVACVADVVVALDEQDRAAGDAGPQGQWRLASLHPGLDLDHRFDGLFGVDPDQHGAVS